MIKKFKDNFKYLKLSDFLDIFIFILVLIPAMIFKLFNKLRNKKLWIISESKDTARDNGYHFYKYVKEKHKEQYAFYVIDKKSKDYQKVKKYGNIIQYRSLKHWIYYLASDKKISSQKASNPSPALFYVIHIYLNLFNNRIYLKHGIIINKASWWHYPNTKYRLFICGAKDEYDFVSNNFNYPKNYVKYTGLARFDNLYNGKVKQNQILIMPTWRNWLGRIQNKFGKIEIFEETNYFKTWNSLINNQKFINYIENNNIIVYFYPHLNMQKYIKSFTVKSKNIKIVNNDNIDIQKLLKESSLLITDYSSVYMDFGYMKKAIIAYQFDVEEYRKKQYSEGYFSYSFGPVIKEEDKLVKKTIDYIKNNYKVESKYLKKMNEFYLLHDQKNCERIYNEIIKI